MKSQDILLLLKLVSLAASEKKREPLALKDRWRDWQPSPPIHSVKEDRVDCSAPNALLEASDIDDGAARLKSDDLHPESGKEGVVRAAQYSVRGLAASTGISKSQISLSLQRCIDVGLAKIDRKEGIPRANAKALSELIVHGVRYVFPARPGELTRGIPTSLGAPVLEGQLMTAGDLIPVWPDAHGNTKGLAVTPLAPSVPQAVRRDPLLYALLALTDAIRIGQPRERNFAAKLLTSMLQAAE